MEHITAVDPEDSWPHKYGYWLRIRGILSAAGIDGIIAASLWGAIKDTYGIAVIIAGLPVLAAQYVLRSWYLSRVRCEGALHSLCHHTRDDLAELVSLETGGDVARTRLREFNRQTAQRIAAVFRAAKGDSTLGCCIRLAQHDENDRPIYATVGRSDNFDPSREENSVPIPGNAGIAKVLMEKETQGVLIIRDILKATQKRYWSPSPNDSLPDIRTVMVAPINGWSDRNKTMQGILYVTSQANTFSEADTNLIKAIADTLGMVYGQLFSASNDAMYAQQSPRG